MVRFPARPYDAPSFSRRSIYGRGLCARPLAMRLDDVDPAEPADALVAFLHLTAHVPRADANLPFVHVLITAERASRRRNPTAAPAADGRALLVPIRLAPLVRRYRSRAPRAHRRCIGTPVL